MGYPYGTKGAPALGHAPGLPRRAAGTVNADPTGFPAKFIIARNDQLIRIPDWATYCRMGATGKAGNSTNSSATAYYGSGGGGFAGSTVVKASPGASIGVRFDATGTIVEGLGYRLVGGAGGDGTTVSGPGGVGSGGDVNFNGGAGGAPNTGLGNIGAGGGAAGRGGSGGNASQLAAGNGSPAVGYLSGSSGGSGNPAGTVSAPAQVVGSSLITIGLAGTASSGNAGFNGVDGGGGATSGLSSATPVTVPGGAGFALIEFW